MSMIVDHSTASRNYQPLRQSDHESHSQTPHWERDYNYSVERA